MRLLLGGLLVLMLALPGQASAEEATRPLRVVIHVHTTVSTGSLSLEQVLEEAARAGVDAVVFTDSAIRRWEYGVWPLRGFIKRVEEQPSVSTFGPGRYLAEIADLERKGGPVIPIAGVEAAPFYFWRRSPLDRRGGEIHAWNQHLLMIGLDDPGDIKTLPLGVFDPYQGDRGSAPYQHAIDVATGVGTLVFWAHPDMGHTGNHGAVSDYTEPYPHLIEATSGYHGFAITYLDRLDSVRPGGVWDTVLAAYARGARLRPAWLIAESDWRGPHERALEMSVTETLADARTRAAILQAFAQGKMWGAIRKPGCTLRLDRFVATEVATDRQAISGERLSVSGPVTVSVRGQGTAAADDSVRVRIVRNGEVVADRHVGGAFNVRWTDEHPAVPGYYRAIIEESGGVIYTNPVFIR